ncbi:F-box/kelch-repeat protein At3g23880-like isoform X2 [Helianthus annuus]|nr:F-box/kelch-repeat protein At3g23880-like isoform X2 [Helianthus annuus]
MAELALDVVERILPLLDVKDIIRCKSVCKSWRSVILSLRFVKAHLNNAYTNDRNNHELGHRRVCLRGIRGEDSWFLLDYIHIVGSCNGLLCVSPIGVKFVVINPSTREHKKLPTPPFQPHVHKLAMTREVACWGFGYDSSSDDYKVIAGFMKKFDSKRTSFLVLTLKSNTWKVIGQVKYSIYEGRSGVFYGGALHWFMTHKNLKKVIISLDLSTEEFKEIPMPDVYMLYFDSYRLGVIEECLCIYSIRSPLSTKKWVMKNNKWELYIDNHCQTKYDVAHYFPIRKESHMTSRYYVDDGTPVPINGDYIRASIFVKSLVSPHPHVNHDNNNNHYDEHKRIAKVQEVTESVESGAKGHIRKRKKKRRSKRSCKHKKPLV